MKVWSRAGSKKSTTNSPRAKEGRRKSEERKRQRGGPEQASCSLLPPPQGRSVLSSELNPLNPSRTNREQKDRRSRGQQPHGGGEQGRSCKDAQTRPRFWNRITLAHFCQTSQLKTQKDSLSMFPAGWWVSKRTIPDPPSITLGFHGYRCLNTR